MWSECQGNDIHTVLWKCIHWFKTCSMLWTVASEKVLEQLYRWWQKCWAAQGQYFEGFLCATGLRCGYCQIFSHYMGVLGYFM